MPQSRGFFDYVAAAFNARPLGMFVPPNWIGLAAFGLLGFANPGFWVLGAGLELGYLALLSTNSRFQRTLLAADRSGSEQQWEHRIRHLLGRLRDRDRRQYEALAARCRAILDQQGIEGGDALQAQGDGLGKLLWMYLRLLVARQTISHVLEEAQRGESIDRRVRDIEARMAGAEVGDDLRRSLTSQLDILRQRQQQQGEAKDKLAFLDAELVRIQDQVELIREQAAVSTDPERLSRRIDEIAATLGGTAQWIRDQQQVYGAMEDLLADPPTLLKASPLRQTQ
jgi:hypothetical protein